MTPQPESLQAVVETLEQITQARFTLNDERLPSDVLEFLRDLASQYAAPQASVPDGEDAKDAEMFRFLERHPNLYTVADLLKDDQYVNLRRACEALIPLAAPAAQAREG